MARWLTYWQAARRVRRSVDTIQRWRRAGMPMSYDARGRRVVEEAVLLAYWRQAMVADPTRRKQYLTSHVAPPENEDIHNSRNRSGDKSS
jgi:hypothetical protein